ncbi:MAG: hypothetical protein H8D22_04365, partial [Candidatus Cloacimonetes bacterium]|nr:hypothetical protein [Candidatus Cloacimonadota bacterium]
MITWQELKQDPRYFVLNPELQDSVKHRWFEKNIEIDPRYKPELRDTLWYRIFKKPEIRPIEKEEWYPKIMPTAEKLMPKREPEKPSLLKGIKYGLEETGKEQLRKLPETLLNLTTAGLSMSYLPRMLEDSKTAESRIKFWQQHTDAYG